MGVDAYVWLHRGAYGCAAELCQGKHTTQYLHVCFQRLNLLLRNGVGHVYIVFDGGPLPAKQNTEQERRARREESRQKALQLMAEGHAKDAFAFFAKAIDVTPVMAKAWVDTIQAAKLANVSCVVAPYEADAQLAYMCRTGDLDAVFTEDSDLLATGCPRVLFKLNESTGMAQQIMHADLFKRPIPGLGDLRTWAGESFLAMCILSGCDYLPSVPGLGLRSAYRLIQRHKTASKAIRAMRFEAKHRVPTDYETRFFQALQTFRHQRVFDLTHRTLTHVHPLPPELIAASPSSLDHLGPWMEDAIAASIADCTLDPILRAPFPSIITPTCPTRASRNCLKAPICASFSCRKKNSVPQSKIVAFLPSTGYREEVKIRQMQHEVTVNSKDLSPKETSEGVENATVFKNVAYRPGLRRSTIPLALHGNKRITSFLLSSNKKGLPKSIKDQSSVGNATNRSNYLDSVTPSRGQRRPGASPGVTNGKEPLSGSERSPLLGVDQVCKDTITSEPAVSVACRGSHRSSWFGTTEAGPLRSNGKMGLPSLPPMSTSKRRRTLGGRPSMFALRRFKSEDMTADMGASKNLGAFGGDVHESNMRIEEEDMWGGDHEGIRSDTAYGGYASDSLQPPTPGTPCAGTATPKEIDVVEAETPTNRIEIYGTNPEYKIHQAADKCTQSAQTASGGDQSFKEMKLSPTLCNDMSKSEQAYRPPPTRHLHLRERKRRLEMPTAQAQILERVGLRGTVSQSREINAPISLEVFRYEDSDWPLSPTFS